MVKILCKFSFIICVAIFSLFIIYAIFFPHAYEEIIPYRFYTVLTNSMEPKIGANSLVLVKSYENGMKLEKNTIITFLANRFGEKIIITHRFSHTELNENGEIIYRTHPESGGMLDIYETESNDILGVYLFHIPYMGKIILFLKSPFGVLWLCQVIVIFLIKALILARWKERWEVLSDN